MRGPSCVLTPRELFSCLPWQRTVRFLIVTSPSGFRNKEYNKVEDLYDTRIPLHNEDVFEHGLRFKAKVRVVVLRSHHLLSVLSYIGEFK